MRSLEWVNIRTNLRTYVLTYIRTGQILYPLHNFVVRGDNNHLGLPLLSVLGEAQPNAVVIFFLKGPNKNCSIRHFNFLLLSFKENKA